MEYKTFRIGDIFEKLSSRFLGEGDKFKAVSKIKNSEYNIPMLYAKSGDNGIMYWSKEGDFEVHENTIGIIYNGAIAAGLVYAQREKTGILAESYLIRVKDYEVSFQTNLFLAITIKKCIFEKYSRDYLATWKKVENEEIKLPVTNNSIPDWGYMEQYVKLIEEQYIKLIDVYLLQLGYQSKEDTVLGENDKLILNNNSNTTFRSFRLDELFDFIKRGRRIKSLDRIDGDLPFITAGVENTGLSSYIGNPEAEIFPENSITIDMFGNTFYRGYEYGADDHVAVLYNSEKKYSKKVLQYIQPCINKAIAGKFSYARNFYASDAPDVEIDLPVTDNGQLDTKFMESYISVIEKKVVYNLRSKMDEKLNIIPNF